VYWLVVVPVLAIPLAIALVLNRRQRQPDWDGSEDDPRFAGMNKQGLGWGIEENDRGGLQ